MIVGDELAALRRRMDHVDDRLLALLAERLALAEAMGRVKRRDGAPARDAAREAHIVERLGATGRVDPAIVDGIWHALFAASRRVQDGAR